MLKQSLMDEYYQGAPFYDIMEKLRQGSQRFTPHARNVCGAELAYRQAGKSVEPCLPAGRLAELALVCVWQRGAARVTTLN
jgi:hypothetical protein